MFKDEVFIIFAARVDIGIIVNSQVNVVVPP